MILLGVLTYVSFQVVFGLYASRRVRSEEDHLLGGRAIGPTLATSSAFATWFGAETCIGAAALVSYVLPGLAGLLRDFPSR